MGHALAFQFHKIRRAILTHGRSLEWTLMDTNDFGEPNGEAKTYVLRGVYHEVTGYLSRTTTEDSTVREKPSPQFLILHEDSLKLKRGMQVKFNDKTYELVELKNLSELNLVCSVSLEEVQTSG